MRGTGDVSGSAGPAQAQTQQGSGPAWVTSQTCILHHLDANRSLGAAAAAGGDRGPVTAGGDRGPVTAGGLDLHVTCTCYLPCVSFIRVTSIVQTLNSFRTPWNSHLSVSTTGGGVRSDGEAGGPQCSHAEHRLDGGPGAAEERVPLSVIELHKGILGERVGQTDRRVGIPWK
ncbi:hypothetical protein D4764_15G0013110 [Takifugu flavidus]|uniref:Uncharacterized protein n=1 Tax=Takifugu flavidus TaxID=433684 RepID=A0A5C6P3M6_9TELE|nr:hypothetical protein D4764_15G0013110 [Takifugu flavidus]